MSSILHLELDVVDDPSVLLRIVSICHQRGCRIMSLHYERAGAPACVQLGVDAENPRATRLEFWLSKLIHVLAVRTPAQAPEPEPALATV